MILILSRGFNPLVLISFTAQGLSAIVHCFFIFFFNLLLLKISIQEHDKNLDECKVGDEIFDVYMFSFQQKLQQVTSAILKWEDVFICFQVLVITGVLMIPIMLLGKPLYILNKRRKRRWASDHDESGRRMIMIIDHYHADDNDDSGPSMRR